MNKKELAKQFPWLTEGEIGYEISAVMPTYKTERGFINHLARMNERNKNIFSVPDIKTLRVDIEWKKSRTWGFCPHAEWDCWFADGTYMHGNTSASGYGYDKHSQVLANIFNEVAKGMAWRKRMSRKKAPYGLERVGKDKKKDWPPYYEGGIGAECYKAIGAYLGGKTEHHEGKTWDAWTFTFKGK